MKLIENMQNYRNYEPPYLFMEEIELELEFLNGSAEIDGSNSNSLNVSDYGDGGSTVIGSDIEL